MILLLIEKRFVKITPWPHYQKENIRQGEPAKEKLQRQECYRTWSSVKIAARPNSPTGFANIAASNIWTLAIASA